MREENEVSVTSPVETGCSIDYKDELERLVETCRQAMQSDYKSLAANKVISNAVEYYQSLGIGVD